MLGLFAAAALLQPDRPLSPPLESTMTARLYREETFVFSPNELRSLAAIDLWLGQAKLADGRCLLLKIVADSTAREPAISHEPGACADVSPTSVMSAVRCGSLDDPASLWRIGCRKDKSRHQLIAVHSQTEETILLAETELEMLFVSAVGLHDWIMIRTMTLRKDGKAVISWYQWHPPAS